MFGVCVGGGEGAALRCADGGGDGGARKEVGLVEDGRGAAKGL